MNKLQEIEEILDEAREAAWSAYLSANSAAWSAASLAAYSATYSAAYTANLAASSSAYYSAYSTTYSEEYSAAVERKKQVEMIKEILNEKITMDKPEKYNINKPMISLVRPEYIEGIARVLTYGASKYNEKRGDTLNYLKGEGFHYSEIYDSLQRHLGTWQSGDSLDDETKLNHLLHAASNIMFLYTYEIGEKGIDDRINIRRKNSNEEE